MKKPNWGDWGIRVGALALAFFLWFYAVTEHLYEKEIRIRLRVENPPVSDPPAREVVVANLPPDYVRVLVSGRGKDLLQLDGDGFLLRVEPEGSAGSVRSYRLTPALVENRTTDLEVRIEEIIEPKEIEIALDWRAERSVPVEPVVALEIAEAYVQVGKIGVEPEEVNIIGPRRQVLAIDRIQTDSLVLKEVSEEVNYYPLALRKPAGMRLELNPVQVRLRVDVQILAEDDIAQVPVEVRYAGRRNVDPEPSRVHVRVRGGVDIIANLDPVKDLNLFVDYRDFSGGSMLILIEKNELFNIIEIVPPRVNLIDR